MAAVVKHSLFLLSSCSMMQPAPGLPMFFRDQRRGLEHLVLVIFAQGLSWWPVEIAIQFIERRLWQALEDAEPFQFLG